MADAKRNFLGLTHNPFTHAQGEFFDKAERKLALDQLRNLNQWTRRVLLVTGRSGAGKSMLYMRLPGVLEPRVQLARIDATLINGAREVLHEVARAFDLEVPGDANVPGLARTLLQHVGEFGDGERVCLVMVDDAHRLDYRTCDALLGLAQLCRLRLILLCEPDGIDTIRRSADRAETQWHELVLQPFNNEQVREYLEWRFSQARYRGRLPFTTTEVREIARASEGLPGRIDELASERLIELETGNVGQRAGLFPPAHRAAVALVAVLSLIVWVIMDDAEGIGAAEIPAVAVTPEKESEAVEGPQPLLEPPPDVQVQVRKQSAQTRETKPLPTPAPGEPVAEASAAAQPARTVPPAAPASQRAPAASGARDEDWLLEQPPGTYTVQLVTLSSADRAERFVSAQAEPQRFATYRLQRDDRTLFVVVYGLFDDKSQAERAAASLPSSVGDLRPWVRSLEHIQANIRG